MTNPSLLMTNRVSIPGATDSPKPRYELLDGLRGVAAMLVIMYHFGEGFATSPYDQMMNHGYLAVDFFFILSGFVLGYAYDDRWSKGMTTKGFLLRRIIRLHPMVVISVLFGALAYVFQGSVRWDGTPMPLSSLLTALILGLFLIPILPGAAADVRGNNEMFPLNGPSWSLFFEYIGSILYAIFLHRLSSRGLKWIVALSAVGLCGMAVGNLSGFYHLGVGWSLMDWGLVGGFFRLSFSFSVGLLMSRDFKPLKIRGAFWICTLMLVSLFSVPYVGGEEWPILNAFYDLVCTLFVFPLLVYVAASGHTTDKTSTGICEFLGRISYPVYMVHYPIMYLFYAWVWDNGIGLSQAWPVCLGLFILIIVLAVIVQRFYDAPVRACLSRLFLSR